MKIIDKIISYLLVNKVKKETNHMSIKLIVWVLILEVKDFYIQ